MAACTTLSFADSARAQEEAPPDYISGSLGLAWNSHFISYGFDVWGTGGDFGDNSTFNPTGQVNVEVGDVTVFTGFWADVNNNAPDTLGGSIQEIDVWLGASFGYEDFSFSVIYQSWNYASGTEHILDFIVGFDDTGMIIDDFAFNPSLTVHNRIASDDGLSGLQEGTVLVFGVAPGFTIYEAGDTTIDMSIPVNVGVSLEDGYFTAGGDSGYAFTSVGLSFSMPMTFIPEGYGDWSLSAGVTAYFTESSVYSNPDDSFLTASVGISTAF